MELSNANIELCSLLHKLKKKTKIILNDFGFSNIDIDMELKSIVKIYKKHRITDNYYYDGHVFFKCQKGAHYDLHLYNIRNNGIRLIKSFYLNSVSIENNFSLYVRPVVLKNKGILTQLYVGQYKIPYECINAKVVLYLGNLLVLILSSKRKYINNLPIELYNYIGEVFFNY